VATVALLALDVFLLLAAYYLLKVAREPLILLSGGAEVKSYASAGQSLLLVFVSMAYGWLSTRVGRTRLISLVTLFFAANLVVFAALGARGLGVGLAFFLWVGIFNIVTVAQFWSFAADVYSDAQGRRLFPVIGIGSSLGAVGGAAVAAARIHPPSPYGRMVSTLAITHLVHRRDPGRARPGGRGTARERPFGRSEAFRLVLRDRYLMALAVLVFMLSVVTRIGDYVLDRSLLIHAPTEAKALGLSATAYVGQFKARFFQWTSGLSLLLQALIVSRVLKHVGVRVALLLIPLASAGGYGVALAAPFLGVLFAGRVLESSVDYSLSNTVRQALWLVTSDEKKYKAKQVVDTFFVRAGDAASALLVWLGVVLTLGPRHFLAVNLVLSVVWLGLAALLGREYARRQRAAAASDEDDTSASGRAA
jgi:AAA family ATP:ADP antiporter